MALPKLPVSGGSAGVIDFSQITAMQKQFGTLANGIKEFSRVQPEIGAYMKYSIVLEKGAKGAGRGRNINLPARPHLLPAVVATMGIITGTVVADGLKILADIWDGRGGAVQTKLEKMWTRILMGAPRQIAVATAPYEFGFHRRSITGSGRPLSDAELVAMQARWTDERKRETAAKRKRKK